MFPLGGWAVAQVKLGACAGAAWFPKEKELPLDGSRPQPIRGLKRELKDRSWVKGSLKIALGLLTDSAVKLVETGPETMLPQEGMFSEPESAVENGIKFFL